MSTSLVRIPITLAAAFAFHVSFSPPIDAIPPIFDKLGRKDDNKGTICTTARVIAALLTKGLYWTSALTDAFVLLAPHLPSSISITIPPTETLLAHPSEMLATLSSSLTSMRPLLASLPLPAIAGTTLTLGGMLLRHAAFDALGQFYACRNPGPHTCQPRVKGSPAHAHALITTGPYAFVRHPGYAGLMLCTTGLTLLHLDVFGALKNQMPLGLGWVRGLGQVWSRSVGTGELGLVPLSVGMRAVALVCAVLVTVGALTRIEEEEQALRARFKGEWVAWTKTVRYKLVPGIY